MTIRTCGRVVPFGVAEMEVGTSMFIGSAALVSEIARDTQPLECVFGFVIKRAAGTLRHFRAVARSLCEVAASFGEGQGGLIATFRYAVPETQAAAHRRRLSQTVLPALAAAPGIAGCHLLVADEAASSVETSEKKVRAEANEIPRWIVLVESWDDVEPFKAFCDDFRRGDAFTDGQRAPDLGIYRLQNSRSKLPWSVG